MTLGSGHRAPPDPIWARIDSLPALYVVWALMGLAMAATLYEPAFAAIVGGFPSKDRDRDSRARTAAPASGSTRMAALGLILAPAGVRND
jgi:hypothetical protein